MTKRIIRCARELFRNAFTSGDLLAAVLVSRIRTTTRHERTSLCRYFGEWTQGREYVRSMNHSVHRDVDAARWREGGEDREFHTEAGLEGGSPLA